MLNEYYGKCNINKEGLQQNRHNIIEKENVYEKISVVLEPSHYLNRRYSNKS